MGENLGVLRSVRGDLFWGGHGAFAILSQKMFSMFSAFL